MSRTHSDELFAASRLHTPEVYLVAHIDGGSRGNPGPAGYGVVVTDQDRNKIAALSEYLGHQTNNYAEYHGLLAALDYALMHSHKALKVIGDSELLVKQIRGEYKVKSPALQDLYQQAKEKIAKLEWFVIQHVLREKNHEADRLANFAMDKGMGRLRAAGNHGQSGGPGAGGAVASGPRLAGLAGQEYRGVVRDGVIVMEGESLPEGTRVDIRVRK
jgi:ribonuclease HI